MSPTEMMPEDIKFILNALRQSTIKWSGRAECLQRARKKVFVRYGKRGQPIYKYHWKCADCKQWKRDEKSVEVDHIKEIGTFTGDWNATMRKMFPRPVKKHMQVLCIACHMKKTLKFNAANTQWKRKKK